MMKADRRQEPGTRLLPHLLAKTPIRQAPCGIRHASFFLIFSLLWGISCRPARVRPDEVQRDRFFAEIIKRESCRCLGEDGFFEKNLMDNPYPEVRLWCAVALGRISDRRALPWLYAALRKGDSFLRAASAFAIGEIEDRQFRKQQHLSPDPNAVIEMVLRLDDSSRIVRMRAVEALGKMGSAAESAEITKRLERFSCRGSPIDRAYLEMSITALERIGDPSAAPVLRRLAATGDPEVQQRALRALVSLRDKGARALFVGLSASADPHVRFYAARGIGILGDPSLASLLFPLLPPRQEPGGIPIPITVRLGALKAIGDLKNPAAIPEVQKALEADPVDNAHPDQVNFAIGAASAIASIGAIAGESALLPLLECPEPVASQAVVALARILRGKPDRFFALTADHRFAGPAAMRAWVRSMAELGGAEGAAALNTMLLKALEQASPDTELIGEILRSLAKIDAPQFQDALRPFLGWSDPAVLQAAVAAYRPKPGAREPWAPVVQAFESTAAGSNLEARIAILNHLRPWVGEKAVQNVLLSSLKDHERSIRLIAAGLLRSSGAGGIDRDPHSLSASLTDAVCMALAASRKNDTLAVLETTRGNIEIELFRDDAPATAAGFISQANRGAYDGLEFHKADPASIIEVEDPPSSAAAGRNALAEINMHSFARGSVGMAGAGLDSQTARFFIAVTPQPELDGWNTCFGRVISGMEVADKIVPGDRLKRVSIREIRGLFPK